jgi:hypothetical protein
MLIINMLTNIPLIGNSFIIHKISPDIRIEGNGKIKNSKTVAGKILNVIVQI